MFPQLYKEIYFLYKSVFDFDKIIFIKSKVNEGDTVVDIGSNIGFYTKLFSKIVGKDGKVYSFEPDIKNFKILKSNKFSYNNVKLFNIALGSKNGSINLFESKDRNTDHQTYDIGDRRSARKIRCAKGDYLLRKELEIRFIKIDTQGYDYYVLEGMKNLLSSSRNIFVVGEMWPYGLYKSGILPSRYLKFLKDMGFKVNLNLNFDKKINDKYYYTDFIATKA